MAKKKEPITLEELRRLGGIARAQALSKKRREEIARAGGIAKAKKRKAK